MITVYVGWARMDGLGIMLNMSKVVGKWKTATGDVYEMALKVGILGKFMSAVKKSDMFA